MKIVNNIINHIFAALNEIPTAKHRLLTILIELSTYYPYIINSYKKNDSYPLKPEINLLPKKSLGKSI